MILNNFCSNLTIKKKFTKYIFLLLLVGCCAINVEAREMILDDLSNPGITSQKQNWSFFTDGVMGGLSKGKAIISKIDGTKCYHMTGDVTTKNNGGFIQIRSKLKPDISTSKFRGIYLKVFGNGEEYSIHLRTALTRAPWQYYKFSFKSSNQWNIIKAPFKEFKKSNIYLPSNVIAQNINSIGLVAGFRDFSADICMNEIGFY